MAEASAGLELPIGVTEQKFLQQLARIEARALGAANKMQSGFVRSNKAVADSFGAMSGQARGQLQNVSYQLQDIFVQISSGTSATRALGQQLPQLLSGFGALGAVLGTVSAFAIPMAAAFLSTGEGAANLGKQLDDLNSALSSYKSAIDSALAPMDEMWAKFGDGAEAAKETYAALLEIEKIDYLREMSDTVGALQEKMSGLSEAVARWQAATTLPEFMRAEAISGAASATAELQAQFGIAAVEANRVAQAMAALSDARTSGGPAAMAEAARELADQLMAAYEAGGRTNDELLSAAKSAYELYVNAGEAARLMGDTADATISAADAADNAAAATANWAATMSGVRAEINAIASALAQMGGGMIQNASKFVELNALKQGKSVAEAARARQQTQMEAEFAAREMAAGTWAERMLIRGEKALAEQGVALDAQLDSAREASREAAKASGGGGRSRGGGRKAGGGGRSAKTERPLFENVERDIEGLQREIELLGKSNEEIATAKARWGMLDEAKKRGVTVNAEMNAKIEQQAAQVGKLTGELERAEIAQSQFDSAIEDIADTMAGAIVAGESLRDGLANIFKQIASDILSSGIKNAISGQFSGGGGLFGGGNPFANLFGGFRANGGPVSAGRAYVVGERGPEMIVPKTAGSVIPNHKLGGGGGSYNLTIDLRGTTGDRELDAKIRAGAAQAVAQANRALPAKVAQVNRDPLRR